MKCRNFKNLVNVQNAVKPMIQIKVEDLDANENMLNTWKIYWPVQSELL